MPNQDNSQQYRPYTLDQAGVHKVILNNDELIDELMLTLQGQIVDTITNEIKIIGKPMVSEQTLSWMIGRLLPYTSKIFILSFLKNEDIRQMKYEFGSDVIGDLMFPEKIEVSRKDRDYIKGLMIHTFGATIHKAENGETLTKLMAQHSITEQILHEHNRKKSGMGSLFPDMFGRNRNNNNDGGNN